MRPDEHGDLAVVEGNEERAQSSEMKRVKNERDWALCTNIYIERSYRCLRREGNESLLLTTTAQA